MKRDELPRLVFSYLEEAKNTKVVSLDRLQHLKRKKKNAHYQSRCDCTSVPCTSFKKGPFANVIVVSPPRAAAVSFAMLLLAFFSAYFVGGTC